MSPRTLRVAQVVEALREVPPGFARAVATDADGTLWEGDVGDALFRLVVARDALSDASRAALAQRCAAWLGEVPSSTRAPAEARISGHAAGRVDIRDLCDLEAACAGDRPQDAFDELLETVARDHARHMRDESVRLLDALRGAGFAIHVVTGSLGALVRATLRVAGVAVDHVSGGELAVREGAVTSSLVAPIPLHGGKVDALRAAGHWPAAVGMGDGGWDATFLRGCALPLLVHPKPALLAAMKDHPQVARLSDVPITPAAT
ncbi:MAG: HAD family hydrolase [Polyangiales bacterium]